MRTGDEPSHARSPLRMRLVLASFGLLCAVVGSIAFAAAGSTAGVIAFLALGLVALVDLAVIVTRIRQGPHFQPGATVPPYRPVDPLAAPRRSSDASRAPPSQEVRTRRYLVLMSVCLTLLLLAWVWVRLYSITAAVLMTVAAMVIPPLAAVIANAGGFKNRGGG